MKHHILSTLVCAIICVTTSAVSAGDFTTDFAQFQADVPGQSFPLNIEALTKF